MFANLTHLSKELISLVELYGLFNHCLTLPCLSYVTVNRAKDHYSCVHCHVCQVGLLVKFLSVLSKRQVKHYIVRLISVTNSLSNLDNYALIDDCVI